MLCGWRKSKLGIASTIVKVVNGIIYIPEENNTDTGGEETTPDTGEGETTPDTGTDEGGATNG